MDAELPCLPHHRKQQHYTMRTDHVTAVRDETKGTRYRARYRESSFNQSDDRLRLIRYRRYATTRFCQTSPVISFFGYFLYPLHVVPAIIAFPHLCLQHIEISTIRIRYLAYIFRLEERFRHNRGESRQYQGSVIGYQSPMLKRIGRTSQRFYLRQNGSNESSQTGMELLIAQCALPHSSIFARNTFT